MVEGLKIKDCKPKKVSVDALNKIGDFLIKNPGFNLRAFRSGGGLRVVRIQKDSKLIAYGEHPHLDIALEHLAEDIQAGGREYSEVYNNLVYDHYLTGTNEVSSPLDHWLLGGNSFSICYDGSKYKFSSKYYYQRPIPNYIQELVVNSDCIVQWQYNDFIFETSPYNFPGSGEAATSTKCLNESKDKDYLFEHRICNLNSGGDIVYFIGKVENLIKGIIQEMKV